MDEKEKSSLSREIRAKALRKIRAKRRGVQGVWYGLGMMGLIGWSVTVPTLLGAGLGFWIDKRFPGSYSWTLTIMLLGLILGCVNAWHWIRKESAEMEEEDMDD
ncbi:MAG: AtpZ/AtpI family protein [Kiritimatiellae bacterium]|jgi:ATP synthase protein I|nr:AtpZ/AtpI family protein [Kiritimatiellia bacterium]